MRRWKNRIAQYIGRWQARRMRTRAIAKLYRAIDKNQARIDKGESL